MAEQASNHRRKRKLSPLDTARLEEIALAYVARFATSAAKLEAYLRRKLRERGWDDGREADPAALVMRYVELGYVDDEGFARARTGSLMRRGYGPRRVAQALHAAGIGEDLRESMRASEAEQRKAALVLASKRGFGPFGAQRPEREQREKQIAAMLRAGHSFDMARALVDADSPQAAADWAAEAQDEGEE